MRDIYLRPREPARAAKREEETLEAAGSGKLEFSPTASAVSSRSLFLFFPAIFPAALAALDLVSSTWNAVFLTPVLAEEPARGMGPPPMPPKPAKEVAPALLAAAAAPPPRLENPWEAAAAACPAEGRRESALASRPPKEAPLEMGMTAEAPLERPAVEVEARPAKETGPEATPAPLAERETAPWLELEFAPADADV